MSVHVSPHTRVSFECISLLFPVYVQIPECGSIGLLVCRFVDVWANMHAFIFFLLET